MIQPLEAGELLRGSQAGPGSWVLVSWFSKVSHRMLADSLLHLQSLLILHLPHGSCGSPSGH